MPSASSRARSAAAALVLGVIVHGPGAIGADASVCDRACLTKVADAYYAALKAHDARALPQAANARITENGSEKKLCRYVLDRAGEAHGASTS